MLADAVARAPILLPCAVALAPLSIKTLRDINSPHNHNWLAVKVSSTDDGVCVGGGGGIIDCL